MYHWVKLMLTSGYTSCRQSTFVYLNLYRENKKTVRRGGMKRARERERETTLEWRKKEDIIRLQKRREMAKRLPR